MSVEAVRGNLESRDLERREEALCLPTPASKEELSQELFSWEHGIKEMKFSSSLRAAGPQAHLFVKDMCVILCLDTSAQQILCHFRGPAGEQAGQRQSWRHGMKLRLSAGCRMSFMVTCNSTHGMIPVTLEPRG